MCRLDVQFGCAVSAYVLDVHAGCAGCAYVLDVQAGCAVWMCRLVVHTACTLAGDDLRSPYLGDKELAVSADELHQKATRVNLG